MMRRSFPDQARRKRPRERPCNKSVMANRNCRWGSSAATTSTEADTTGQQEHDEDDEQDGDHGRGTTRDRIGPDAQVPRRTGGTLMSSALIASLYGQL
jgi:hypothetical protein